MSNVNAIPLDHAVAYVHYTLNANYWYAKMPTNPPDGNVSQARAHFYDRLAHDHLDLLNNEQRDIARNLYHAAYKAGRTWRDYHLPLVFQGATAHSEIYPVETYELLSGERYMEGMGWL